MAQTGKLGDMQVDALARRAEQAGVSRRKFLLVLASGGAAAALAACTPRVTTPAEPVVTPPAPTPPSRTILKPLPEQYFIGLGTNAEMRFEVMARQRYATPNSFFYVRSHSSTPEIDVKTWRLRIEGDGVGKPLELGYDDLLSMPSRTVTRFVECAGNGRSFYDALLKKPAQGGQWRLGAYGIADWTGVPLSAILERAGVKQTAVDVMPTGLDSLSVERPMPIARAMSDDVIVAYMMNGDILPPDHGFPARVIVPGWVGINSIKWVGKITVSEKPILVEKNTTSYVLIGPDYAPQPPAKGPVLTDMVVKSACALPWPATLKAGAQKVTGYAWSPFGKIAAVDVSTDGGKTFQPATLTGSNIEAAGTRWEFSFAAQPGDMTLTPRATDDRGNSQHDITQQRWNELGYVFGAVVPHPAKVVA